MAAPDPPRFSVVIPCYNGGAYLPGALASVRAQTVGDVEIVVVDDGSDQPETLAVLDRLGGDVRLVRQENKGLAAARNAGMAAATGAFLLPLDCDDALAPCFLEATAAALGAHPEAAFAFTHLRLTGDREGVLAKGYNPFAQLFLNQLPYCMLMRRAAWERLGGYDETMRRGYEDWEFNIRAGAEGLQGIVVPEPLFIYRVSAAGMLKSVSSRIHGELWADIQRRHPQLYGVPALLAARRRWCDGALPYPAALLFALWAAHRLLPVAIFDRLFGGLFRFSASGRADAFRRA